MSRTRVEKFGRTPPRVFIDPPGAAPTKNDRAEIFAFQRFLALGEQAPLPGENSGFLRRHRGWLPYVFGAFLELREGGAPAPPVGCDDLPFTAWTMPG